MCKDEEPYRSIGLAVDRHCKKNGFLPIQYLLGHGIGDHILRNHILMPLGYFKGGGGVGVDKSLLTLVCRD